MNRAGIVNLICDTLRALDPARFGSEPLTEETQLLGRDGMLDSIGLVNLLIDVEGQLNDAIEAPVSIADERALSQSRSPFRTIGSMADYVDALVKGNR